jgi:hypothetical protein
VEHGGTFLCALDRDERAPTLIAAARGWAAATTSRVRFVHVTGADDARAAFAALGVAEHELHLTSGDAVSALRAEIAETRPALVLAASSAGDGRLGSVSRSLLADGGPPLGLVPRGSAGPRPGSRIACAVSLGDHDEHAIRFANGFAAASGRRLVLRSVLGAQDAAAFAAARAVAGRAEVLSRRMLDLAREADADALVVACRPGDAVCDALESPSLWDAATCAVIVVRG